MSACISYRPNAWNVRHLAPPPADPPAKTPRAIQIEDRPRVKHPRVATSPSSHAIGKVRKPQHYRQTPETCQHARIAKNGTTRVRCLDCGTERRTKGDEQNQIMSGAIPFPAPRPKRRPKLETKHGTRYGYQAGCRCAKCKNANRMYYDRPKRDFRLAHGMSRCWYESYELHKYGFTNAEISELTGLPKTSVTMYLNRARKSLK